MSLCDRCKDPGMCCREITLNQDFHGLHLLEALVWMATVRPNTGELGLPFIPVRRIPRARAFGREDFETYPCPLDEVWLFTWREQPFDLRLTGNWEGNCDLCVLIRFSPMSAKC